MLLHQLSSIDDAALAPFARLTENQLRQSEGLMIVESPKVIKVALEEGYLPQSLLCESKHITGDAAEIIAKCPASMPVYTGQRALLESLTGYKLTRGVLCAMIRPQQPTVEEVCRDARRVAVIDQVCDTTNIGAIFRSAAALGIDAVLCTPGTCDPWNRRSIRVSMGSVFLVPWTWLPEQPDFNTLLRSMGFMTVAMALTDRSVPIDDPGLNAEPRLAIVLGTEGDGLAQHVIDGCDYTARIPMHHRVDSLNVAAASAVAFYQLTKFY
ncbi:MAG: RNA methyltransferase [Bacteroidales bacterium]|nr:RNA methyltransferase [Bacteroidales bacterium]